MPMIRLFIPYLAGITAFNISGGYVLDLHKLYLPAICLFVCLCFAGHRFFGAWASLLLMVSGYIIAQENSHIQRREHFSNYSQEEALLWAEVTEQAVEKPATYQLLVRARLMGVNDTLFRVDGRLMLYLSKEGIGQIPSCGDVIIVKNRWREIDAPRNPAEFDYKRYLAGRNVFHSSYLREGQWFCSGYTRNSIMKKAATARERALSLLRGSGLEEREMAVVSALLLGYREYLDPELRREFAGAGAMHILCVSGLHVGILYFVLLNAMMFLKRVRGGEQVRVILIIAFIWIYAAITGLSPSVLRASLMFSLFALGRLTGRRTVVMNTLAASAFILVTLNPNIVRYIGFQLSYLAVAGIVNLQPSFFKLYKPGGWLLGKTWTLVTVSLAAQLATGPLSVYYFNQFPNYFLLTNLITIPLAAVLIHVGIAALVFSPVPLIGQVFTVLLAVTAKCLHASVGFIEGIPGAVTRGVYMDGFQTLLVYVLLLSLFAYLFSGVRKGGLVFLFALLAFSVHASVSSHHKLARNSFVVYSISGVTAVDFISSGKSLLLSCEGLFANPRNIDYNISGYRRVRGVRDSIRLPLDTLSVHHGPGDYVSVPVLMPDLSCSMNLIHFDGKIIAIAVGKETGSMGQVSRWSEETSSGKGFGISCNQPVHLDYLIISSGAGIEPAELLRCLVPDRIIIDSSHTLRESVNIENMYVKEGFITWNVRTSGAYVYNCRFAAANRD